VYCRFDFRCPNQCTQEEIWFTEPIRIVTAFHLKEVVRAMQEVDAAVAEGMWAAGYVRYEAAPAFEGAMQTQPADPRYPLVCFGIFAQPSTQPPITKLNGLHNGQLGPMQPGVTRLSRQLGVEWPGLASGRTGTDPSQLQPDRHTCDRGYECPG